MNMMQQEVELLGITKNDIQDIFQETLKNFKEAKTRIIYLDASYLYTFHLDDFQYIRKLNLLTRYHHFLAKEWHRMLERWYQDQTVVDFYGRPIKPIKISRTFDRVTNEGMGMVAANVTGTSTDHSFEYRTIGDGTITEATPSDIILVNEVDRINVNDTPEGGSLSRDGTTIYSIGNHSKTIPTPANGEFTECGMHSTDSDLTDLMFDHSVFAEPIEHTQNADAPGSTTVIYMCSA